MKDLAKIFSTPDYLAHGNAMQRKAWDILIGRGIFGKLSPYDPVLAGTFPIGIDIPASDLDIICRAADKEEFKKDMLSFFAGGENFTIHENKDAVICNFIESGMPIEVFGSGEDPLESNAYRHMIVEARLLHLGGSKLKNIIVAMKKSGMKTEPAFASVLGLEGDPYEKILELEMLKDSELAELISIIF